MSEIPVQKQYDEYIDCAPDKFGCEVDGEYRRRREGENNA